MRIEEQPISNFIALGEGFTIEFKRSGISNLGREICAFANATGGVILIGVADAGEVVGIPEPGIEVSEHWVTTTFIRSAREGEDRVESRVEDQAGTKSGPSWGPSRHQVGTKSAPRRHQVGTKSAPSSDSP